MPGNFTVKSVEATKEIIELFDQIGELKEENERLQRILSRFGVDFVNTEEHVSDGIDPITGIMELEPIKVSANRPKVKRW